MNRPFPPIHAGHACQLCHECAARACTGACTEEKTIMGWFGKKANSSTDGKIIAIYGRLWRATRLETQGVTGFVVIPADTAAESPVARSASERATRSTS